jgi:hypothetical protein
MNVSIHIPEEIETTVLQRASAAGKDVATIVEEFVVKRLAEDGLPRANVTSILGMVPPMFVREIVRGTPSGRNGMTRPRGCVKMGPASNRSDRNGDDS